ncbi:MAG: OmpA family protein [Kofleriaceae bacterium]
MATGRARTPRRAASVERALTARGQALAYASARSTCSTSERQESRMSRALYTAGRTTYFAGSCIALATLGAASAAYGDGFSVKLEPGLAVPLNTPQSNLYDAGGGGMLKALFGLTPYLDVGPAASVLVLPGEGEGAKTGVAWGIGGGLRIKRPHDAIRYAGASPWFDFDALYVRTGELNRPGFDAAVGVSFPLDADRKIRIGPFARYMQTITLARDGYDSTDAKVLLVGISLELGTGIARAQPAPIVTVAEVPAAIVSEPIATPPDRDHDGTLDDADLCPDVAGPPETSGCPKYEKVIVAKDKLELKEKLYFAWNKATLEPASYPVLDEVVQALKDNTGFRVQVEGHADSSGAYDHNQTLSEQRATAVLEYLAAHGIANSRLASKGFSSSVPLDTNGTVAGRENNRRVEFVVSFVILKSDGAK